MITLIEVLNYRCLRHIHVPLRPFQILVGPNASGKTTFLDVIAFLNDFINYQEPLDAIFSRAPTFKDIFWMGMGNCIEFVIEARIPDKISTALEEPKYDTCRYELKIISDPKNNDLSIGGEILWMKSAKKHKQKDHMPRQINFFPELILPPQTIMTTKKSISGWKPLVKKRLESGKDLFYSHKKKGGEKAWDPVLILGTKKSTLANLPEDEENFSVATWFKKFISESVQRIELNSELMGKASPPGKQKTFSPDGSNLPVIISNLKKKDPNSYQEWINHIKTALPDIKDIEVITKKDDLHSYIKVIYDNGLNVPSWLVSDGTLRFFALTLLAYLPDLEGIYLIEEPENGIHPQAISAVYDSLSSIYKTQVLVATHSPVFLSVAEPRDILCFAKDNNGATNIINGKQHPQLKDWQSAQNLGTLFASGILG